MKVTPCFKWRTFRMKFDAYLTGKRNSEVTENYFASQITMIWTLRLLLAVSK